MQNDDLEKMGFVRLYKVLVDYISYGGDKSDIESAPKRKILSDHCITDDQLKRITSIEILNESEDVLRHLTMDKVVSKVSIKDHYRCAFLRVRGSTYRDLAKLFMVSAPSCQTVCRGY